MAKNRSKIMFVGGGSGGHVVPILSIMDRIKNADLRIVTDRKYFKETRRLVQGKNISVKSVSAGKFRRYTGFGFWDYVKYPSIMFNNFLDFFRLGFGIIQSFFMLVFWRPKVILLKGGYVGVPIGLVANILKIPMVLHESDAGSLMLANRILSKFATKIFTGAPVENYNVPENIKKKMEWVGVPLTENTLEVREKLLSKEKIDIPEEIKNAWQNNGKKPIVFIVGGSLGSQRINEDILQDAHKLDGKAFLVLASGAGENYTRSLKLAEGQANLAVLSYTDIMDQYMAISKIVVARAGATTLAILEALMRPTILVPHAKLPNGHQSKNAKVLEDLGACVVIEDKIDDTKLNIVGAIERLLDDQKKLDEMSKKIGELAKTGASEIIAEKLMEMK